MESIWHKHDSNYSPCSSKEDVRKAKIIKLCKNVERRKNVNITCEQKLLKNKKKSPVSK